MNSIIVLSNAELQKDLFGYLSIVVLLFVIDRLLHRPSEHSSFSRSIKRAMSFKNAGTLEKLAMLSLLMTVPFGISLSLAAYTIAMVFLLRIFVEVMTDILARYDDKSIYNGTISILIIALFFAMNIWEVPVDDFLSERLDSDHFIQMYVLFFIVMMIILKLLDLVSILTVKKGDLSDTK